MEPAIADLRADSTRRSGPCVPPGRTGRDGTVLSPSEVFGETFGTTQRPAVVEFPLNEDQSQWWIADAYLLSDDGRLEAVIGVEGIADDGEMVDLMTISSRWACDRLHVVSQHIQDLTSLQPVKYHSEVDFEIVRYLSTWPAERVDRRLGRIHLDD